MLIRQDGALLASLSFLFDEVYSHGIHMANTALR